MQFRHLRRETRCLHFAKKCLKHPVNKRLFPKNENKHDLHEKNRENFVVTFARGDALKMSTIPYLQRRLNPEFLKWPVLKDPYYCEWYSLFRCITVIFKINHNNNNKICLKRSHNHTHDQFHTFSLCVILHDTTCMIWSVIWHDMTCSATSDLVQMVHQSYPRPIVDLSSLISGEVGMVSLLLPFFSSEIFP